MSNRDYMHNQTHEEKARDHIDEMLRDAGWDVQSSQEIDLYGSLGQAVREYQTDSGPADYVLFVDGNPIGVIEAKRPKEGQKITVHELQTQKYAIAKLRWFQNNEPLPFLYESTGEITRFTDQRDPKPRSREVFSFHRPETLRQFIRQGQSLRQRLQALPELNTRNLRDCQVEAIANLDQSLKQGKPRALIQMATGSGKTFTAITTMYRLLKYANAQRILFLVDTKNLGEQAEQEMMTYTPNDDNRKFTELYRVQRLTSPYIAKDSHVCISTIQRMYSILKGEELDETAEEMNPAELKTKPKEPMPVVYNPKVPLEFFDFIFIDECHRSIYNVWQQVLDYFDGFLIGLTATPDNRTYGFFEKNVVSEYDHEKAIADGVNVGNEVFLIETKITKDGARIKSTEPLLKREKLTRKKRWEQSDEEVNYTGKQLDRDVVNPDQIRTVIRTFKDRLPDLFPGREEVPKTLFFAKDDSHADDIIQTVRKEFNEGNEFCKKVTYRSEEDPKSILAQFRNGYHPRIAVTVDMIATGTDVKPLECLVFMRDVKSLNYFEQMKGRGTRTLDKDALVKVTPSAKSGKTHYVIVDAVGVTKSRKTSSQPLITKPSVVFKDLAMGVMMGAADADTVSSLVGRLSRLNSQLEEGDRQKIAKATGGVELTTIMRGFVDAINPDNVERYAQEHLGVAADQELDQKTYAQAQGALVKEAVKANRWNGKLIDLLTNIRREKEQIIDDQNLDQVTKAEWDADAQTNAQVLREEFEVYLRENQDEIEALSIFFGEPYRRREVTFSMVSELLDRLRSDRPKLAPIRVWRAYQLLDEVEGKSPTEELTALVSLVRRVCGADQKITNYGDVVRRNFQNWVLRRHAGAGEKFNEEQMAWLRMMRDHVVSSFHFEIDDLEMSPFDGEGGLGKMYQLFGAEMNDLIEELNTVLSA
ncbi:restriction endonuclease subunit R [Picosynechococcus sp. PCC 7003]|uniref:type I restriction endonuclease subunit R n=1 Tax=Picosynechococcus sp. PCC 7003 TaxID=374981 RepID=UPI000810544B|nr:DEAD/DEAH box helicase family protein [Picosynechococcus sp. PCC 7003]ANV83307.1 restriction endonuclease subunit R [Picosynechococcus sp. PCC 7003]